MEIKPLVMSTVNKAIKHKKKLQNLLLNGSINDIDGYLNKELSHFTNNKNKNKKNTKYKKQKSRQNKKNKKNRKISNKSQNGGDNLRAFKETLTASLFYIFIIVLINGMLYGDYHPLPDQPLSPLFAFLYGILTLMFGAGAYQRERDRRPRSEGGRGIYEESYENRMQQDYYDPNDPFHW